MHILVTGATGFIGRALVAALLSRGNMVTALVRPNKGRAADLPQAVQVFQADLRDANTTAKAVRHAAPSHVVHLAAEGVTEPFLDADAAIQTNLIGTVNLLNACFMGNGAVTRCLVARTPGENAAMNVYAASKAAAWKFCQMYARTRAWPIRGARIFQAYGPGQPSQTVIMSAFAAALEGKDFPMTSGTQERDWIYLADVVSGLLSALREPKVEPGMTVDLGTGKATPLREVVDTIYALVDRGGCPRPGTLPDRPGESPRQVADANRTSELLDWRAQVLLPAGLERLYGILSHAQHAQ